MKNLFKSITTFLFAAALVFASSCTKNNDDNGGGNTSLGNVTVTTLTPTDITSTGATCGAEVIVDAGATLIELGVCWSTTAYPTVNDSYLSTKNCENTFVCVLENLTSETKYHVRAYALNGTKYVYGEDKEFTTLVGGGGGGNSIEAPIGAVKGLFSVSADKQVFFSQGNLQYQASTNTWRFAENQWDYVGGTCEHSGIRFGNVYENGELCDNTLVSNNYSGWIDMFCWGTSGYYHGANCYQPWDYSENNEDFYAYNDVGSSLSDETGKADWGYNRIQNGGNKENLWRTPTYEEWVYLLNTRNTTSGFRYAKAIVNSIEGLVLFPDDWQGLVNINQINNEDALYGSNVISSSDWILHFEGAGAAFLPSAGEVWVPNYTFCYSNTYGEDREGWYWMSDLRKIVPYQNQPYDLPITNFSIGLGDTGSRRQKISVRLVQDYQ